jgi:hypothetical protein
VSCASRPRDDVADDDGVVEDVEGAVVAATVEDVNEDEDEEGEDPSVKVAWCAHPPAELGVCTTRGTVVVEGCDRAEEDTRGADERRGCRKRGGNEVERTAVHAPVTRVMRLVSVLAEYAGEHEEEETTDGMNEEARALRT